MSRAKRRLLVLVVLIGAAVAAILLVPRGTLPPGEPFAASGVVLHTYTEAGELAWEVSAASGEIVDEQGALADVRIRFLHTGEESLTATADRFVQGEEISTLSGNVRIEREDLVLATDAMTWNEREERLSADDVELWSEGVAVTGSRFAYDLRDERATIEGGVEATFPEGTLHAEEATIDERGLTVSGQASLRLDLGAPEVEEGGPDGA